MDNLKRAERWTAVAKMWKQVEREANFAASSIEYTSKLAVLGDSGEDAAAAGITDAVAGVHEATYNAAVATIALIMEAYDGCNPELAMTAAVRMLHDKAE